MKQLLILTALTLAATHSFAQSANTSTSSETSSGAMAGSMAIGGGAVNASIGGSSNTTRNMNRNVAAGGAGGNGAATSNVTVNLGSTSGDPSASDPTRSAVAAAQNPNGTSQPSGTYRESVETVGSPGSMSYGVSFSQYNCANTAGVGAGFMGGAFQIGIGKESNPCNARANAAALFSIAQTLASTNAPLSAQLYHAAILLIGNSTSETREALAAAGVSDWAPAPTPAAAPAIVPPPADESKATPVPVPKVVAAPLPDPVKVEDTSATVSDYQLPPADTATADQIAEIKAKMFPAK